MGQRYEQVFWSLQKKMKIYLRKEMFTNMRIKMNHVFGGTKNTVIVGLAIVMVLDKILVRHIFSQTKSVLMKENLVIGTEVVLIKLSMVTFRVKFNVYQKC